MEARRAAAQSEHRDEPSASAAEAEFQALRDLRKRSALPEGRSEAKAVLVLWEAARAARQAPMEWAAEAAVPDVQ